MLKKLQTLFAHLSRRMFIIADANDSSITLSKKLCRDMGVLSLKENRILVFAIPINNFKTGQVSREYGFTLNPKLDEETQLCEIQYNSKHRCVGFETLCPTVNRIFYDYSLPANSICKLLVKKMHGPNGLEYYTIVRPFNQSFTKHCHDKGDNL